MSEYLLRKLLTLPLILLSISAISFSLMNLAPGDPAYIILRQRSPGVEPPREAVSELRERLHLDKPAIVRYGYWLVGVGKGDLGRSYRSNTPIVREMLQRFPATVMLAGTSLVIAILFGIPSGVLSAVWKGSAIEGLLRCLALVGAALPNYALALLLVLIFSVNLRLFPAIGYGKLEHVLLPAVALAAGPYAQLARLTRASLLDVLEQDYLRTARSKGFSEGKVVVTHALKNALLPVVTILGVITGHLLGGTVIVETIFGWPGIGKYAVDSIFQRDYPVVQGFVLYMAVIFLMVHLVVDLTYRWLDPRLQFGSKK